MWPVTLYGLPITKVEKLEKTVNLYIKKWLGGAAGVGRTMLKVSPTSRAGRVDSMGKPGGIKTYLEESLGDGIWHH